MRSLLTATVVLASLSAPAIVSVHAQDKTPMQLLNEQKRNENADVDKRYNATVKRTSPDQASKVDPWRTIRPAEATAKKPAEPKHRKSVEAKNKKP